MCTRLASAVALAFLAPVGACETTFLSVSSDGRIEIVVSSSGLDPDTDGFTVSVDGGVAQFVPAGSAVTLTDLSAGTHSVRLDGISDNCRVDGANPREVVVGSDGTASVRFDVRCDLAATGAFVVVVTTGGQSPDPDGYRLSVSGEPIRDIGTSATETYGSLTPALHLVQLKDVDPPCVVDGPNPRPVTVLRGQRVTVELRVVCRPPDVG